MEENGGLCVCVKTHHTCALPLFVSSLLYWRDREEFLLGYHTIIRAYLEMCVCACVLCVCCSGKRMPTRRLSSYANGMWARD